MKFFQKFVLVFLLSFATLASADFLSDQGISPSASAASGASAADASKKAEAKGIALRQCTHQLVASFEMKDVPPEYPYYFNQFGFSSDLIGPLTRYTLGKTECFKLVPPREAATAAYAVKVSVLSISAGYDVTAADKIKMSFNPFYKLQPKFNSVQLSMTVIDLNTGDPIATVVGNGTSEDLITGAEFLSKSSDLYSATSNSVAGQVLAGALIDASNKVVAIVEKVAPSPVAATK